jgi:hypothetical protein
MRHARLLLAACAAVALAPLARAQEMPKPGPEHERLKELAGTWDCTVKFGDQETKGTMVYKMELGGFWLVGHFEADMGGQRFTGLGVDGYDPLKKKYVSFWADSMSPSSMWMEGSYDKETHSTTMTGHGPGMDGKVHKFKTTSEFKDNDSIVFTMYDITEGKDNQMMTITYHRKK